MDALLASFGHQAKNMAMRSVIAHSATLAIRKFSQFVKTVDDTGLRDELKALQEQLSSRMRILAPMIELIEIKYVLMSKYKTDQRTLTFIQIRSRECLFRVLGAAGEVHPEGDCVTRRAC